MCMQIDRWVALPMLPTYHALKLHPPFVLLPAVPWQLGRFYFIYNIVFGGDFEFFENDLFW